MTQNSIMHFSKKFKKHISLFILIMFVWTMTGIGNAAPAFVNSAPVLKINSRINDMLLATENGRILESFKGQGNNTVICIQDLHCHKEVQDNIADIMKILKETYKDDFQNVFVEGSWDKLDLDLVKAMPDSFDVKANMIDQLINFGYMTGAEKYAANDLKTQLYGIENKDLYEKDSQLLTDSLPDRAKALSVIFLFKQKLEALKVNKFSKEQKIFSDKMKGYEDNKINVLKYVQILKKYSIELGVNFDAEAPNLAKILKLLDYRLKIGDLNKVKVEAQTLENAISKRLNKDELKRLEQLKTENNTRYYLYLKRIVEQNDISLQDFVFLNLYFRYLDLSADINTNLLVDEERRLKDKIYGFLINTEEQKDLVAFEKIINFYENFINNSVTSKESQDFMANESEYAAIVSQFLTRNSAYLIWAYSVQKQIATLNKAIKRMKEFYKYAEERNNVLLSNTLDKNQKISVMVLGGYHTDGITQILRARNISYILISPNVIQDYDNKIYERRLVEQNIKSDLKLTPIANNKSLGNDKLALVSIYQADGLDAEQLKARIKAIVGDDTVAAITDFETMGEEALVQQLQIIMFNNLKAADLTNEQLTEFFTGMNQVLGDINLAFKIEIDGDVVKINGQESLLSDYVISDQEKLLRKTASAKQTRIASEKIKQEEESSVLSKVEPQAPRPVKFKESQTTSGVGMNCLFHATFGHENLFGTYYDADHDAHRDAFINFIGGFDNVDALLADGHFAGIDEATIRQSIFEGNVPGYEAYRGNQDERRAEYDIRLQTGELLGQLNTALSQDGEMLRLLKLILKEQITNLFIGMAIQANGVIEQGVVTFVNTHRGEVAADVYIRANLNYVWREYVRLNQTNKAAYLDAGLDAVIIAYYFNVNIQMVFGGNYISAPSFNYNPNGATRVEIVNRYNGHFERVVEVERQYYVGQLEQVMQKKVVYRTLLTKEDVDAAVKFVDQENKLSMEAYLSVLSEAINQGGDVSEYALSKINYEYLAKCITNIFYITETGIPNAHKILATEWVNSEAGKKILKGLESKGESFANLVKVLKPLEKETVVGNFRQGKTIQRLWEVVGLLGESTFGALIEKLGTIGTIIETQKEDTQINKAENALIAVYKNIATQIEEANGLEKGSLKLKFIDTTKPFGFARIDDTIYYSVGDIGVFSRLIADSKLEEFASLLLDWEVMLAVQIKKEKKKFDKGKGILETIGDVQGYEEGVLETVQEGEGDRQEFAAQIEEFQTTYYDAYDADVDAAEAFYRYNPELESSQKLELAVRMSRSSDIFVVKKALDIFGSIKNLSSEYKVEQIRATVLLQINKMASFAPITGLNDEIAKSDDIGTGKTTAAAESRRLRNYVNGRFDELRKKVETGDINPFGVEVVTGFDVKGKPFGKYRKIIEGRKAKIGVYPVAGNPLHWGHLMSAICVMLNDNLDKIVFVIAASDPRKPDIVEENERFPMNQEVLSLFGDLFQMSTIATGTSIDGERNIFRIMQLNLDGGMKPDDVEWHYLVGSDHDKLYTEQEVKLSDIVDGNIDITEKGYVKYKLKSAPTVEVRKFLFRGIPVRYDKELNPTKLFIPTGMDTILKLRETMATGQVIFTSSDLVPNSPIELGSGVLPETIKIPEGVSVHISMIGRIRSFTEEANEIHVQQALNVKSVGIPYTELVPRKVTRPGFSAASTQLRNSFKMLESPANFWLLPFNEFGFILNSDYTYPDNYQGRQGKPLYEMAVVLKENMQKAINIADTQMSLGVEFVEQAELRMGERSKYRMPLVGLLLLKIADRLTEGKPERVVLDEVRATLDLVEKRTDTPVLEKVVNDSKAEISNKEGLVLQIKTANEAEVQLDVIDSDDIDTGIYKKEGVWQITTKHLAILQMMPEYLRKEYLNYIKNHEMLEASLIANGMDAKSAHSKTIEILGTAEHQKWERVLVLYNRMVLLKEAQLLDLEAISALENELLKYTNPLKVDELSELYDSQKRLGIETALLDSEVYGEEIIIETKGRKLSDITLPKNGAWNGKIIVLRGDIADFAGNIETLAKLSQTAIQNGGRLLYVPGQTVQGVIKGVVEGNVILKSLIFSKMISVSAYLSMSKSIVMAPGTVVSQDLYDIAKAVFGEDFNESNAAKYINVLLHVFYRTELELADGIDVAILGKLTARIKGRLIQMLVVKAIADRAPLKAVPLKQFVISGPEVGEDAWKLVVDPTQEIEVNKTAVLQQDAVVSLAMTEDRSLVDLREGATLDAAKESVPVLQTKPPVVIALSDVTTANAVVLEAAHKAGLLQDAGVLKKLGPIVQKILLPFVIERRKAKGLSADKALEQADVEAMKVLASAA